jgi:prepilin-type N-terminal cleavage/methylation domain-containing protein
MLKKKLVSFGFTIVELLVVIVVIGILATISIISYNGITQKAKQTIALTDATNIKKALDLKTLEGNLLSCFDLGGNLNSNCVKINSSTTVSGAPNLDNNSYELDVTNGYTYKIKNGSSAPILVDQNKLAKFEYTGNIVNWTVPTGVTKVNIVTKGAQGGYTTYQTDWVVDPNTGEWVATYKTTTGGRGAYVSADFSVTPGQVLSILVGQQPNSPASDYGFAFPGGGGGTFVAMGANYVTATPLIVAGGGGAASSGGDWMGNDDTGQGGQVTNINSSGDGGGFNPGTNGEGAPSVECGGGGGGFYTSGGNDTTYYNSLEYPGLEGVGAGGLGFRQGGLGGVATGESVSLDYQPGGFGGGSIADYIGYCNTTAGSGGGYSGGSSGSSGLDYGGAWTNIGNGGGSYILPSATNQFSAANSNTGSGQVIISWQ